MKPYMLIPRVLSIICGGVGTIMIFSFFSVNYYHNAVALVLLPLSAVFFFLAWLFYWVSRNHLTSGKYKV